MARNLVNVTTSWVQIAPSAATVTVIAAPARGALLLNTSADDTTAERLGPGDKPLNRRITQIDKAPLFIRATVPGFVVVVSDSGGRFIDRPDSNSSPFAYGNLQELVILAGLFKSGLDEVVIPAGQTFSWLITIPPASTPLVLLSRVIKSFEGGGIRYEVWADPDPGDFTLATPSDLLIGPSASAVAKWERLATFNDANSVLSDLDYIPVSGAGNNNPGGAAGGDALRPQLADRLFVIRATNTTVASRTLSVQLTWYEGELPEVL